MSSSAWLDINALDLINTLCSIFVAVASVCITVLVNFFRLLQNEAERRKAVRELLAQSSQQVDAKFAALFFHRTFDDGYGNLRTISDGDYEQILDSKRSYLPENQAVMRVALVNFLESLRAAAHVAQDAMEIVLEDVKGRDVKLQLQKFDVMKKPWSGPYDPCTTNVRIAVRELLYFWNSTAIGDASLLEQRREFIRSVFGSDKEWRLFAAMARKFDEKANFVPSSGAGSMVPIQVEDP